MGLGKGVMVGVGGVVREKGVAGGDEGAGGVGGGGKSGKISGA